MSRSDSPIPKRNAENVKYPGETPASKKLREWAEEQAEAGLREAAENRHADPRGS